MHTTSHDPTDDATHPPLPRLAAFGRGKLDERESAPIAEHLSACETCRSVVEAVDDDSLAGLLRRANDVATVHHIPASPAGSEPGRGDSPPGYLILETLGEGGMGVVSKARQVALGRLVALKQVRPELLSGPDGVARFRREAEAVARLKHPNIIPIYEIGWRGDLPFFSMEYVEGGTLARRFAAGSIAPREAAGLVETLARAVQHAHEQGVVHRDLKPANILLAPDLGHPKITDFGLAKLDDDSTRTRSGMLLGTPNYMSPEQAGGDSSRVGPLSDVHALGAILYEAIAGRPPFSAASVLETLELVRGAEPTPPRRIRRNIPRDLATIAMKCLEKAPGRRYASALTLAEDLRRHLDGEPIVAQSASGPERLAKWARRRPWQATSVVLGVVLLGGSLVGTLVHNAKLREEVRRTEREAEEAKIQRARAEDQYRSARGAIRMMIGRFDEPRFIGKPLGGELGIRRQLFEDALTFYEGAVRDDAPAEPSARLDKILALREAATFQIMLGRQDDAQRSLRHALTLLAALEADGRNRPEVEREQVSCLVKLGLSLEGSGRLGDALTTYRDAIERAERSHPSTLEGLDDLAWCHNNLGSSLLSLNRLAEAEPHLAKAWEIRKGLLVSNPDGFELRSRTAESLINLANAHGKLGEVGRADGEFAEAAAGLGPIVRDHPQRGESALAMGKLHLHWGWMAMVDQKFDLAIERFRSGLRPVDAMLASIPDWPEAKQGSSQLNSALALVLGDAGRYPEAVQAWDRAIALAEGRETRTYRLGRLTCLARQDDGVQALAQARAMVAEPPAPSGVDLYNFACVAAVAAGSAARLGSSDLAEEATLCSLRWLERARQLGLFDDGGMIVALDHDHDFDPIRARPSFQIFRIDVGFPVHPFGPGR